MLLYMQTQVQTYAAHHISGERGYLGYVLRGCGTDPIKTLVLATATLPNNNKCMEEKSRAMIYVYTGGNIFQASLILLVSVLFLHKKGHAISSSKNTALSSFDNYGLFWGSVTVSVLGNVLLNAHALYVAGLHLTSGVSGFLITGWMVIAQLVFTIFVSLMVAIYYGRKFNFTIPSIFLLPFVVLCCNCANKTSKKLVQCLSIWSLLMFLMHVGGRVCFMFLALLTRPPTVISATLVYIFGIFFCVQLLAIIFTFARAKKKQQWKTKSSSVMIIELVQILVFVVVSITAICFGSIICYIGVLASYGTVRSSPYSTLSALLIPSALAAFGWALRKVGSQWLNTFISSEATEVAEQEPLLQEVDCEEGHMNVKVDTGNKQEIQGRRPTLIESLLH